MSVSLVLSFLPFLTRQVVVKWAVLCFKSMILLLIGVPLGSYLGIELTLLTILLIEIISYTKFHEGLIFSTILIALILFMQHRLRAWGVLLPAASLHDILSVLTYSVVIVFLTIKLQSQNHLPFKELNRRLNEATFRLAETNIQLQEYAAIAEEQSVTQERKRISREFHDTIGYTLTNLVMMLEAAKDLYQENPEELTDHLERTRDQAKEGLLEIRRTLHILRTEENRTRGLAAIQNLVNAFTKATHLEVDLNLGDAPLHLGEEVDWAAYRLVQEGITNAIRHGKATQIYISFFRKDEGIAIQIRDNGSGTSCIEEGYGLIGMRERIERLGGRLSTASKPGEGFKLDAWFPLDT
ncbi:MAG: sensor histidine kinase [Bacteroidota bacterium]